MKHINPGGCRNNMEVRTCQTCKDNPDNGGACSYKDTATLMLQHSSVAVILEEIDRQVSRGEVRP